MNNTGFFNPPSFNLVTLNCLGVPFVQNTRARLATLARELTGAAVDAVCLQEVQFWRYVPLLQRNFSQLPFTAVEPFLYAPKGGLMTMSRHRIKLTDFTLYPERGWWHTPSLTDRLLHKGILAAEFQHAGQSIILLNTHLTANYDGDWSPDNRYARLERQQLRHLAQVVNGLDRDSLVIIAGDFNLPRHSWLYDEFIAATGVIDPLDGHTQPTYYPLFKLPRRYHQPIDHVFVRPPRHSRLTVAAKLLFEEKMQLTSGGFGRLSDHAAIQLSVNFKAMPGFNRSN